MRYLAVVAALGFLLSAAGVAAATTSVVESISGSPGDWTYTYTLTNEGTAPIWHWAVWFPSNPQADTVTSGTANWAATDLATQGFFPEEYVAFWGTPVKDSLGSDLAGPNGEPGFLGTYASDYTSANPGQYWDGSAWVPLPDPLPGYTDPIWNQMWRGGDFGWNGAGANIQTSYGIPPGGTGEFTVHSSATAVVGGPKTFSFNTTDYWYSLYDPQGTSDWSDDVEYLDFEGSGPVVPEPLTTAGLVLGLGSLAGYVRRRRA